MASLRPVSQVEFQAVVLACGPGENLKPLTGGPRSMPKSMLPVANQPLLYYQLRMLEHAGFTDVIVVTRRDQLQDITTYVSTYRSETHSKLVVEFAPTDEAEGTGDILRQIHDKIFTDFMVIAGDLITEASLSDFADIHRTRDATVTMLLKERSLDPAERKKARKAANNIVEYIGVVEDEQQPRCPRVVFAQTLLQEEPIAISKALLKREPKIAIKTHLADAHLYLFKRCVIDVLMENPKLTSVRVDLLPHLINLQYQHCDSLPECLRMDFQQTSHLAEEMSAHQNPRPHVDDVIRCFAMVAPISGAYTCRANNLVSYKAVNQEVATGSVAASTPWEAPTSKTETDFKGSLFGEACEFGEKVSIKNCIVGNNCKIRSKAKLNNCILMDFVTIETDCVIQNSVICSDVVVAQRCNLNDCQIGPRYVVQEGQRRKNEVLAEDDSFDDGVDSFGSFTTMQ